MMAGTLQNMEVDGSVTPSSCVSSRLILRVNSLRRDFKDSVDAACWCTSASLSDKSVRSLKMKASSASECSATTGSCEGESLNLSGRRSTSSGDNLLCALSKRKFIISILFPIWFACKGCNAVSPIKTLRAPIRPEGSGFSRHWDRALSGSRQI